VKEIITKTKHAPLIYTYPRSKDNFIAIAKLSPFPFAMHKSTGAPSQPSAITASDAVRTALLGEDSGDYEPMSLGRDDRMNPSLTEVFVDLLTSDNTDAPGGAITRETLDMPRAPERHALAALSQVSQEIASLTQRAKGQLSKKQLVDLRQSMPNIRKQLNNIKHYARGKHVKPKKEAAERAYSKLVKCLAMHKEIEESSDDGYEERSTVEAVPSVYNTGNSVSYGVVCCILIRSMD
jgi:uncharacterized membrane protein